MATTDPWDFSTTKASNIDIGGSNIGASMVPSNVNDAFQNLAAHIAKLLTRSSDLASAATLNLDSISSEFVDVTGTTTTTAITLTEGQHRFIRAAAAWPITASGTLIVNGSNSVSYTCAAGDFLLAEGYATGVVRISPINRSASVAGTNEPPSDDGAALGSTSLKWSDLFLASGGVINWDAGDVTVTHSSNVLAFAGAGTRYSFSGGPVTPSANDGIALGTGALAFSDLFLASGGVINWNNGTFTATQSSTTLALSGGITLGTALPATSGGTGQSTWTQGDLPYASASNTVSKLAKGTTRQILRMNSGATVPEWTDDITLGTSQTTTSGTSKDFSSLPAGLKRIVVNFGGVSTSGTSIPIIQLGDAGGLETSGYLGSSSTQPNGASGAAANVGGTGFELGPAWTAGTIIIGSVVLERYSSADNSWVCHGVLGRTDAAVTHVLGGSKTLTATLDRIRLTTVGGSDTFDAGSVNISYEY